MAQCCSLIVVSAIGYFAELANDVILPDARGLSAVKGTANTIEMEISTDGDILSFFVGGGRCLKLSDRYNLFEDPSNGLVFAKDHLLLHHDNVENVVYPWNFFYNVDNETILRQHLSLWHYL